MSEAGMCKPQCTQACMGLGVTSEEVWAEPVLAEVLDFAARSFKVRWRLLRHNQTANKTVNKNNSAFKGYVPK
jgi:hypothetical protein